MKGIVNVLLSVAVVSLVLSAIGKLTGQSIAGIGYWGFMIATIVVLLFSANLALLELLNKK